VTQVKGEKLGAEKRAKKTLGKGRGCVLGSSQNGLNGLILNWWLLVHSSLKNQVWNQTRGCIKNLKILETEPKVLSN
jgi:hypothetical protein